MPRTERTLRVEAPPSVLMGVITDFARYPDFLPGTESATVLVREPAAWEVRFRIRVIRELEYVLRLTQPDPLRLDWSLVEGPFRSNEGGWRLEPIDGGAATQATYGLDVQVGMYVPGNIVRSLTERSLPDTLARFKAEAEGKVA